MKLPIAAILLSLTFVVAAAAGTRATALRARLAPIAAGTSGSGTFTGTAVAANTGVTIRWRLSTADLSGRATRAALHVGGASKIDLQLCKPCASRSSGAIVVLRPVWRALLAHTARVVVDTRAHPGGELAGTLLRS